MAPAARVRPYKDFLTPALHRRFAMATTTLFALCYVESVLIGEKNSLIWSWFPLGRAGIRAGLLFIPAFAIFILRVAQLHVGIRTSYSPWHTFRSYALKFDIVQTTGWYFFSAWMFSEIYIWSASKDADLNRITTLPRTDRTVLNERPIYLTCYLLFVAVAQSIAHLFYDYDRIDMPVTKTKPEASCEQRPHLVIPPNAQLKTKIVPLLVKSLTRALAMALLSPFIYSINFPVYPYSVRRFAWSYNRSWAKIFWNLPKSGSLPSHRPFHMSLLARTAASGFLLILLWEVGNVAFSAYVAQEPLKNERPITYESRDPNGSLLTGLRGKKLQTRAFAFWELVYIAQRFQGRRKIIFEEIDRKGGSTWAQILDICLEVITGMEQRINAYEHPATITAVGTIPVEEPIETLPRISQPLRERGDIFGQPSTSGTTGSRVIRAAGDFAKSHGQSSPSSLPTQARKLLMDKAEDVALSPQQKEKLATEGFGGLFKEWATWVLQTPVGWIFRQEYRRKIAAIVLGQPFGDVGIVVDATDSLTRFAVCSLTEDKYGNVQRDIRLIIQTFTKTIVRLENFRKSLGIHWTDIEKKQESPELDTILAALKGGLHELVEVFGAYGADLSISRSEMRLAREASRIRDPVTPEAASR